MTHAFSFRYLQWINFKYQLSLMQCYTWVTYIFFCVCKCPYSNESRLMSFADCHLKAPSIPVNKSCLIHFKSCENRLYCFLKMTAAIIWWRSTAQQRMSRLLHVKPRGCNLRGNLSLRVISVRQAHEMRRRAQYANKAKLHFLSDSRHDLNRLAMQFYFIASLWSYSDLFRLVRKEQYNGDGRRQGGQLHMQ